MSPESVKKAPIFESSSISSLPALLRNLNLSILSLVIAAILGITTTAFAVVLPSAARLTETPKVPLRQERRPVRKLVLGAELGTAKANQSYSRVLSVSGGSAPYQFSIAEGGLPAGLTLNPTTGSISGTPKISGSYRFAIVVTDQPRSDMGRRSFGLSVTDATPGPGAVNVNISPGTAALSAGALQQFSATVTGTSNTAVTWKASAGNVSSNGMYTAPMVSATTAVTVTATSMADPSQSASAGVTVAGSNPGPPAALAISTTVIPTATAGISYAASLLASGGKPPYKWSVSGTLPSGIQLDPISGTLSGTTSAVGPHSFTAQVTDASSSSASAALNLGVASQPPTNSTGFDGPAELPRIFLQSAVSDTPSPGNITLVTAGASLQQALNAAQCGDTLELQAGATFSGSFTLPAKPCDDQHWITIRTSAPNSALPPEGIRLTPCFAGVASLPARPALNCQSTQNVMARLLMPKPGDGPIVFAAGANHYRLLGLEITRSVGGPIVYHLVVASPGPADHVVLDRVWVHGTPQDEVKSGLGTTGMTYVAVVDSTFTDMHCISHSGSCTDGNAIGGGNGNLPMGPYKIVNNFLEAGGENIIFGGAGGSVAPADIEIRRNHMFKPLTWLQGQPGFVGGPSGDPFMVKNLFELKNAERLLFEGNILENSWGGFSQRGWGIVLTPRGSWAPVQDITIRYNTLSHTGAGMQLCATKNLENGVMVDSLAAQRWSIHDIVIEDVDGTKFNGSGNLFQLGTGFTTKFFNSVSINHVTGFPDPNHGVISLGGATNLPKAYNMDITNNLLLAGKFIVWSTGIANGCAVSGNPMASFNACWTSYIAGPNALIGINTNTAAANWPAGNFFPTSVAAVQFTNFNNGNGGNYALLPTSPYKNAASDGKDLGADINAVNAATAGVR